MEKIFERYSDRLDVKFGYYEDMLTDKTKYIRDVLSFFEVPESKFDSSKAFSEPAVMNTHFRRGDVDEWRRVYSEALVDRIEKFAKTGFVERYIR